MTPEQARADFERIHRAVDDNDFKLATKLEFGLLRTAAIAIESIATGPRLLESLIADVTRAQTLAKIALDASRVGFERDWT